MKRLSQNFFKQNTLKVARNSLGKFLIRKINGQKIIAMITETEAYHGPKDLASHASRGRTLRTEVMFGPAGRAYVYLIYGMYYCFNIVTGNVGYPAAVLIRGVRIIKDLRLKTNNQRLNQPALLSKTLQAGIENQHIEGPGKVCRKLMIDKSLNKENLLQGKELFVTEDKKLLYKIYPRGFKIKKAPRVGVDYAGKYKDKFWRFFIKKEVRRSR